MKKITLIVTSVALMAITSMGITSCFQDNDMISQARMLEKAEGIIQLKSDIGSWDAAYLTKHGYFCYRRNLEGTINSASESRYSTITYLSSDRSDIVSLISTKQDNIPTQMVTKEGILYFSFPNDTILELVYDDGKIVKLLDNIAYSREQMLEMYNDRNDAFKSALSMTASLLNKEMHDGGSVSALADNFSKVFAEVSSEPYVEDEELISGIKTGSSGNYEFTEAIDNWYNGSVKDPISSTITLWTGNATFKVGGSSCTLSGTIWCTSKDYNAFGTYGILCDEDPSKLVAGMAEYEGTGYQSADDLSYSVDFRGFKPNTTYYYKSYFKFNENEHGGIVPKYGSTADQVVYDTTVKSFKTGDNILTVDVAMCIDVTGSMRNIIQTVKHHAIEFYDLFQQACEKEGIILAGLNSQVIAFQDINHDNEKWMNVSSTYSLPDQKQEFNNFVNALYADDGGDIPESGLEALDTAFSKTDWGVDDGYHRQIVILWTDAPYLIESYTSISMDDLHAKWDNMPSGRRLILFAPYGSYFENGGDWGKFDTWKNTIHESDLSKGFNDFDYILESIIGELTGKARTMAPRTKAFVPTTPCFLENK